ncbi:hypothetical protein Chor_009712 [Crotalus horridus]
MWLCDLPTSALNDHWPQHTFRVLWAEGHVQKECVLFKGHKDCWNQDSVTEEQVFRCELSVEKSTVLQSELESCKELQALEPENKWCLLTIILLMRALDPLVYEQETLRYFAALKSLTSLCHLEHLLLVTHLNLSDNLLSALPPTLAMMRCLEELSLRNNRIQRASALRSLAAFPALAQLNLQGNPLCETPGVRSELASLLPKVTTILLS